MKNSGDDMVSAASNLHKQRLLIVDDEPEIVLLVREYLADTNWIVDSLGALDKANEKISSAHFPVILLDVNMPGDSLNFLKEVKQSHPTWQIVMFTGDPSVLTVREALLNGAYDYLAKPCGQQELLRAIQQALNTYALLEEQERLQGENREYARRLEELLERRTEQLRESELKYRAVFNRAVDAIFLVEAESGTICDHNLAATRLLKVAGSELMNRPISDFAGEIFSEALVQAKQPGHGEWRFERIELKRQDAERRTAQAAVGKVDLEQGACVQIIVRDLTDQLELKERNERIELELLNEQRLSAIGLLVSGVAHNINTPLTGIYGAAQLIKMKHPDVQDIDGVISQVERINGIIRNLMWKSRQEQDQSFQELNLNQLLNEELRFLEADMTYKHDVEKYFKLDDNIPAIMGKYSDFSLSIMNIVRNALDSMYGKPVKKLDVLTEVRKNEIRITVKDTGCGIAPEDYERIFLPFYTTKPILGRREKQRPTGTGLGLSTSQKLLAPYGARYKIESELGKGTSFTVCLPLQINAANQRKDGIEFSS